MEQKKTLWIIAAVSVFLLVVMGAAMILYNPILGNSKKTASINPVEKVAQANTSSTSGWTNGNSQPEATSSPQVNDMFVVSENTTVLGFNQPAQTEENSQSTTIDLNALKRELASEAALNPNPAQNNINITVNLSEKENQAKIEEPPVVLTTEYYTGKAKDDEAAEKAAAVKKTETEPAKTVTKTTATATASAKQLHLQHQQRQQQLQQLKQLLPQQKLLLLHASGFRLQHTAIKRLPKTHVLFCPTKKSIRIFTLMRTTNQSCSTECA